MSLRIRFIPAQEGESCDSCAKYNVGLYEIIADYNGMPMDQQDTVRTLQLCHRCMQKMPALVRSDSLAAARGVVDAESVE